MSPAVQQALLAGGLPFLTALCVAAFARGERRGAVSSTLALVAAYLVAHYVAQGLPRWPYVGVVQGLAYLALPVGAVALLAVRARPVGLAASVLLAGTAVWILFAFHRQAEWSGADSYARVGALASAPLAVTLCLQRGAERLPRLVLVQLVLVTLCLAAALGLSASASYAQLAGGLAAGLSGIALASIVRGPLRWAPGAALATAFLFGGLVLGGMWTAELRPAAAALLLLALAGCGALTPAKESERRLGRTLRLLIPLALAGGAVALAYSSAPAANSHGY